VTVFDPVYRIQRSAKTASGFGFISLFILSGCTAQTKFQYYTPTSVTENKTILTQETTLAVCDDSGKAYRLTKPVIKTEEICGDMLLSQNPHRMKWGDKPQCVPIDDIMAIGLPYDGISLGLKFSTVDLKNCTLSEEYPDLKSKT